MSTGESEVSIEEAIAILPGLLPYYRGARLYYPLLNALNILDEKDLLLELLPEAFEYSIAENDFEMLLNLCELLVRINRFNKSELKAFYDMISDLIKPDKLPFHLHQSYLAYMDDIKNVLVENPNSLPMAKIAFKTNVPPQNLDNVFPLVADIQNTIFEVDPNISPRFEITHNSPYDVIVYFCANMADLLVICQIFYYAFGGAKSLMELASEWHGNTKQPKRSERKSNEEKKVKAEKHIDLEMGPIKFNYSSKYEDIVDNVEYFIGEDQ